MSRRDSQVVDRTVAALETLLASGVQQVGVRHVLALLGRSASESRDEPEVEPVLDPRADPMTGCLPVTAQGGHDGSPEERHRGFRG